MTGQPNLRRIYVLYDPACGLCLHARDWVTGQPAYVELVFLAAGSPQAAQMFPSLTRVDETPEELVAIDDQGGVYRGGESWVMILWAMVDYRAWALRLSTPSLLPLARGFLHAISENRKGISSLLGWASDREIATHLAPAPPACVPTRGEPIPSLDLGSQNLVREYLV